MVKYQYNVILDKELVDECKIYINHYGYKLSPVINTLLEKWLERQKKLKIIEKKIIEEEKIIEEDKTEDVDNG